MMAPMDIKTQTEANGQTLHVVGGVVKVQDLQEAVDLTSTGVFPARAWAKLAQSGPAPVAPVVDPCPPNGRGALDKFPWE